MTRNILPKSDEMSKQLTERTATVANTNLNTDNRKSFSNSMSNSDDDDHHHHHHHQSESSNRINPVVDGTTIESSSLLTSSTTTQTQTYASFSLHPPFARTRLNQWHTNEEIHSILTKCNDLVSLINTGGGTPPPLIKLVGGEEEETTRLVTPVQLLSEWLSDEVQQRPHNGSVFLFDRRRCKSFKKDAYVWKRRKTGGANSVREDRMCLKINGIACIYGCYSHSSLMSTFHRRCYWLLDRPDLVLVHYLQTPDPETGECVINVSNSLFNTTTVNSQPSTSTSTQSITNNNNNNSSSSSSSTSNNNTADEFLMGKEDLKSEIKAMLWPYYLNQTFVNENSKSLQQQQNHQSTVTTGRERSATAAASTSLNKLNNSSMMTSDEFLDLIVSNLLTFNTSTTTNSAVSSNDSSSSSSSNTSSPSTMVSSPIRINFMAFLNQTTSDILSKCNLAWATSGELVSTNISDATKVVDDTMKTSRRESIKTTKQEAMMNHDHHRPVQLSMSSCSSTGGEKLLLIGDWSYEAKYTLVIKHIKLDLNWLNRHVLECTLPHFDISLLSSTIAHNDEQDLIVESVEHKVLKTQILIYENDRLLEGPPVPFEIKFATNSDIKTCTNYKYQLFLLERTLALLRVYDVARFDFELSSRSFEKRVSRLIECLIQHVRDKSCDASRMINGQRNNMTDATCLSSEFQHEGKTLLHLCCSLSGLDDNDAATSLSLVISLAELKNLVDHELSSINQLDIIRNELKLFKLDQNGFTPLMLACRCGHQQNALLLFQLHQSELERRRRGNDQNNNDIESTLWHFQKCIDECGRHGHAELTRQLQSQLTKFEERWASEIHKTSSLIQQQHTPHELDQIPSPELTSLDTDFNLIDHLEDLNSLLNEDTAAAAAAATTNTSLAGQVIQQQPATSVSGFFMLQKQPGLTTNNKSGMYSNCDGFFNLEYSSQPTSSTTLQDLQFTINQQQPQQQQQGGAAPAAGANFNVNNKQPPLVTQISQSKQLNDDQDKKIKALADNIIAAMPYKIKTNSYSISNLNQQQSQQKINFMSPANNNAQPSSQRPFHHQQQQQNSPQIMQFRSNTSPSNLLLKRNAASFDDNYENNNYMNNTVDFNNNNYNSMSQQQNATASTSSQIPPRPASNLNYVESCYSSSTRSSLSPTSSITFQYQTLGGDYRQQNTTSIHGNNSALDVDNSPSCQAGGGGGGDCSTTSSAASYDYDDSSTFHIDSPPSTAEFCQYFNASSSMMMSQMGKMAIETGFAQLTLTDDEQRELYEAALVIQNAYRRYIQRKKKKIKLDSSSSTNNSNTVNTNPAVGSTTTTTTASLANKETNGGGNGSISSHSGLKFDEFSFSRSSSTSLSSLASSNSFKSNSNSNQQQQQSTIYTNNQAVYPPPPPSSQLYIPSNLTSVNVQNGPNQHQFMIQSRVNNECSNSSEMMNPMSNNSGNNGGGACGGKNTPRLGYDRQRRHNDELSDYDDYDENNYSSGEDQRQYQAACVIQKYYRRYRQYENLQKYNEAASKIQTRYRAYKSMSLTSSAKLSSSSYHHHHHGHHHRALSYSKQPHLQPGGGSGNSSTSSMNASTGGMSSKLHHSSIDETSSTDDYVSSNLTPPPPKSVAGAHHQTTEFEAESQNMSMMMMMNGGKQASRKMITARQSSRFSPASINAPSTSNNNNNNLSSSSSPLSPPSSSSSTSSNSSQLQQPSRPHHHHPPPPQLSHQFSMLDFGHNHRAPHLVDIRQFISVDQNQPYRRLSDIQPPRYLTLCPVVNNSGFNNNTSHLVEGNSQHQYQTPSSSSLFSGIEPSESTTSTNSYFVTDSSLVATSAAAPAAPPSQGDMNQNNNETLGNNNNNSAVIYQFRPANYNTALSESNFWNYLTKTSVNLKSTMKARQLNKQQYSKKQQQQIYPKNKHHQGHHQQQQSSTGASSTFTTTTTTNPSNHNSSCGYIETVSDTIMLEAPSSSSGLYQP